MWDAEFPGGRPGSVRRRGPPSCSVKFKNRMGASRLSNSQHPYPFERPFQAYHSTRLGMAPLHNLFALVVLALSLTVFSSALPYKDSPPKSGPEFVCKHPLKRKEWLDYSLEPLNDSTLNHGCWPGERSMTMRRKIISRQSAVCRGCHLNQLLLYPPALGQDGMTSLLYTSLTVRVLLRRMEVSTLWWDFFFHFQLLFPSQELS